jgi:hypothetical protein
MGLDFAYNQLGVVAFGSVKGSDGSSVMGPTNPLTGQSVPLTRGVAPARTGAGVYTLTFPGGSANDRGGVDAGECVCLATLRFAGAQSEITVEQTSDTVKTVRTFDSAGQAADRDFDFVIMKAQSQ